MPVREVLEDALELISKPEAWCQYNVGLTKDGVSTVSTDRNAVRWCALGAVEKVMIERYHADCDLFLDALQRLNYAATMFYRVEGVGKNRLGNVFVHYNNTHEHEEVKLMFKQAIADSDDLTAISPVKIG